MLQSSYRGSMKIFTLILVYLALFVTLTGAFLTFNDADANIRAIVWNICTIIL